METSILLQLWEQLGNLLRQVLTAESANHTLASGNCSSVCGLRGLLYPPVIPHFDQPGLFLDTHTHRRPQTEPMWCETKAQKLRRPHAWPTSAAAGPRSLLICTERLSPTRSRSSLQSSCAAISWSLCARGNSLPDTLEKRRHAHLNADHPSDAVSAGRVRMLSAVRAAGHS